MMKNCKQICLAGVAGGIITLLVGMLSGMLFSIDYTATPELWKPMTGSWWYQMIAMDVVEWLIYAWIFSIVYECIPAKGWKKGFNFGILIWLVGTLPGMAMTYLSMAVPTMIVLSWTAGGLITALVAGPVVAVIFEKLR